MDYVSSLQLTGSHLEISVSGRDHGAIENQSSGIFTYVEGLKRRLTADIGRKDT
jgi:hypothetical protein